MELYPVDIVIHCINIVVLYILLRLILFKPLRKFMLERSKRVEEQQRTAEENVKQSEIARKAYEDKLRQAEADAQSIKKNGEQQAMEAADAIVAAAKRDASQLILDARAKAEENSRQAEEELQDKLLDAAVDIAGRILKREVRVEDNKAVVEAFLNKEEA